MKYLEKHIADISKPCDIHNVKKMYAFGSFINDSFTTESDIDLIVDFHSINILKYADNYFDLKFSLENVLNRKIDLLEEKVIKNPYFQEVILKKNGVALDYLNSTISQKLVRY